MGALITTYFCFESSSMLTSAFQDPCALLLPKKDSTAILVGLAFAIGVVGPFLKNLNTALIWKNPLNQI